MLRHRPRSEPPARGSRFDLTLALLGLTLVGLALGPSSARVHADRPAVVIAGGGDILAHLRVIRAAEEHGWDRVLEGLRPLIREHDAAFANLETPLSQERPPNSAGSPPILGAPAELATALAAAGIDVLSVANNHAWDQWARGAARTTQAVRDAGMGAIGVGPTLEDAFAPFVLEREGLRIAFVAVTERVNSGPGGDRNEALVARWTDDALLVRALARAREEADVVVASVHWSYDFAPGPSFAQRRRAAFLVEHGADVILAHGPHILHGVERLPSPRGEAVCAYSLGNLLSNQGFRYRMGRRAAPGAHPATWLPTTRDGAWLRVEVSVDEGRVAIGRVEAVPLFTSNNFWETDTDRSIAPDIFVQPLAALDQLAPDRATSDQAALGALRRSLIESALGPAVTLVDR